MSIYTLPLLNAILNTATALILVRGHRAIRNGKTLLHRNSMIAAFITSSLFLISYVVYHSIHGSQHFEGQGVVRPVYFGILITHTIAAVMVVPLVLVTLRRGLKSRYIQHKAIAKWTYPIWLYVSVTGVVVYLMLYQLFPGISIR